MTLRHNQLLGFSSWDAMYSSWTRPGMSGAPGLLADGRLAVIHRREGPTLNATNPALEKLFKDVLRKPKHSVLQHAKHSDVALHTAFSVGLLVDHWLKGVGIICIVDTIIPSLLLECVRSTERCSRMRAIAFNKHKRK